MTNETTASQPKSIGDDARFQLLLADYVHKDMARRDFDRDGKAQAAFEVAEKSLLSFIDSRAPAAQASATIQAAPERNLKSLLKNVGNADYIESYFTSLWAIVDDLHKRIGLAATIQEPAMVAEPDIGALTEQSNAWNAVCKVLDAVTPGWHSTERTGMASAVETISRLAAPMVADPAGVGEFDFDEWFSEHSAGVQLRIFKEFPDFKAAIRKHYTLAATVKAVPSEALDTVSMPKKPGKEILAILKECAPKWNSQSIYSGLLEAGSDQIAAPLADKTGGGE